MNNPSPPFEYLLRSSESCLENVELAHLNRIANLRRELFELLEAWVDTEVQARLAHWVLELRRAMGDVSSDQMQQGLLPFPAARTALPSRPPVSVPQLRAMPARSKLKQAR